MECSPLMFSLTLTLVFKETAARCCLLIYKRAWWMNVWTDYGIQATQCQKC